jgi:hypothetical protein
MGVSMMSILDAWEGMFTTKQLIEISNMSKTATKNGEPLHDLISKELARVAKTSVSERKEDSFIRKPIRKCPSCGGILKVFSLNRKESAKHPGMKSKFECCKTCKGSGCGYKEYSIKDVETIIEEDVKNVTS